MKISELISHCQIALKDSGDLEIRICDTLENKPIGDSTSELIGLVTVLSDVSDNPVYFLVCDDPSYDMFACGD